MLSVSRGHQVSQVCVLSKCQGYFECVQCVKSVSSVSSAGCVMWVSSVTSVCRV